MNKERKVVMALTMVLVMLAVPLTAFSQPGESDAASVAPTPSHYAYQVTYTTTEGASQSQIGTVTDLIASSTMTAATTSSQGSWTWSTKTGLGPFNMFYAAISTGQTDSGALSEEAGHVAYILDPSDLTKAVKGASISSSTSISGVISKYNIMLVIPTVYWYSDASGNLYIADQAYSSYLPSDTVRANMKAYAHQVDNGTVYPYLAIGVYEASYSETYGLMSSTGATPKASTDLPTFRSYVDVSNDFITDDCGTYTLWNFYEWTLYKILAQTAIGGKNAQTLIGSGNSSGSGSTTTGLSNVGGPYAAGGSGNSAYAKVFIENAWGSVWEFVDNTYLKNGALYAGSALSNSLSISNPEVSGAEYVPTSTRLSVPASMSQHDIYRQSLDSATWDMPIPLSSGTYPKNTSNPSGASGDSIWTNNNQNSCLFVGGYWNDGASDGLSAWSSNGALSLSHAFIGARLAYMMTADAAGNGTYTVSFEEAQSSRTTSTEVSPGDSVLLPTVKPVTGYDFDGWYSDSLLTQYIGPAGSYFKPDGSTTLYAKYTQYATITLSDGSSVLGTIYVPIGSVVTLPEAPGKAGMILEKWYRTYSGSTFSDDLGPAGGTYTVTGTATIYAKYIDARSAYIVPIYETSNASTYNVDYNAMVVKGESMTLPNPASITGYEFAGWYKGTSGSRTTYVGMAGDGYIPVDESTLAPMYTAIKTITFNADGDTAMNTKGAVGSSITLPQALAVSGKLFYGWCSGSASGTLVGFAGQQYTVPGDNITLYAKYVNADDYYTIHVSKGSDGSGTDYDMYVKKGDSMILPEAADIENFTFSGWFSAATAGTFTTSVGSTGQYYTPEGNIYLNPQYASISYYTVTLKFWKGTGSTIGDYGNDYTRKVVQGESITLPNAKYFANYQLNYWATYSSEFTQVGTYGQQYTPEDNVTLYPIYGPLESGLTYSVTIMDTANGTSYTPGDVVKVQQGSSIRLPSAPTIANKVFDHWSTYDTENSKVNSDNIGITGQFYQPSGAVSIAPVYASTVTVTVYKLDDPGKASPVYSVDHTLEVKSGVKFPLPDVAVKIGYVPTGWATSSGSSTSVGATGEYYSVTSATPLYPIYSASATSAYWTVTLYDHNDAELIGKGAIVTQGYPLTLPAGPAVENKTFSGWATRSGSSPNYEYTVIGQPGEFYTPSGDLDLYARYTDVHTQALADLAYTKDGSASTASGVASYLTASLSSQTIVGDGFVYLVVNKVSLCDYTVSVSGSGVYVVPLVDGLYRLYSAANAECTVTVNVNTQIAQGYKAFYVSGIANQGRSVQVNMNAATDAGLVGGTMDIGGVYCRYDGAAKTWIYGSIENLGSVAPQAVTSGNASFSGTFTLPEGYSVYYVYGIYNPDGGTVQYSGGQIGPAMPTLEN